MRISPHFFRFLFLSRDHGMTLLPTGVCNPSTDHHHPMAHENPKHRHLLPASNTHGVQVFIPVVPSERISPWTFGRGTVVRTAF